MTHERPPFSTDALRLGQEQAYVLTKRITHEQQFILRRCTRPPGRCGGSDAYHHQPGPQPHGYGS